MAQRGIIELKQNFDAGLDLDTSFQSLRPNAYTDALNITRDSNEASQDRAITNIVGNRNVPYTLPAGRCKVIGAKADRLRNTIIYFVWNENVNHVILEYDNTASGISKILENLTDTDGEDILGFQENIKINHIDIVNRDEGDLLFWTDGQVSPKGLIIDKCQAGDYGVVELSFIEAAKNPPLKAPTVVYGDDASKDVNSLRRKLYQVAYRWIYDDLTKSSYSAISEVPIPAGLVGTDNDIDPLFNNFIAITVETGKKNVTEIEIVVRELTESDSDGSSIATWTDPYSVVVLNKEQIGILDEVQYQFNFYNDGTYPSVDVVEFALLFDYLPKLAKAQALANGNVLVYGAITEGYDKIPIEDLEVEITSENLTNSGSGLGTPTLTYTQSGSQFTFTVGSFVPTGTLYRVIAFVGGGPPPVGVIVLSEYTSIAGDDNQDVATQLFNSTDPSYAAALSLNTYQVLLPTTPIGSSIIQIQVVAGSSTGTISTPTSWSWGSGFILGLVYKDEKGRSNGVVTFADQNSVDSDFAVNTPQFELDSGTPKTPVINASINHTPPTWAKSYQWVRTKNLTFDKQFFYVTCDYQSDSDYLYFCLQNVEDFFDVNSNFIYPNIASQIVQGDRIKILAEASGGLYSGTLFAEDYEILGTVERNSPDGTYVKVKKPTTVPSYVDIMLVMIYTPAKNISRLTDTVFFEFGQCYDIYEDSGFRYHRGMTQDQDATNPALFQFTNGDMYYKQRQMYYDIVGPTLGTYLIMDANYSDFYLSSVNANGRGWPIEPDAKETYFPATVRFGQAFQPNTNINGLNRFYPNNFQDYDRVFGTIHKLSIRDRYMHVGQEFKIGAVPIYNQISKDSNGQILLAATDQLLNPINYYNGEYGCDSPESWTSYNFADYFCNNARGVILRLANNGLTDISVKYKVNSWAVDNLPLRTGISKIYGAYDPKSNNYIIALEEAVDSAAQTLSFDEETNTFESFLSYTPEMMCVLGTLLVSFKDGELWTHDSDTFNNFYGTAYESSITVLFNDKAPLKKTFNAVGYQSNVFWTSPTNGDIKTSFFNPQTNFQQESQLKSVDFDIEEGMRVAAYKMDANSMSNAVTAVNEGDFLKGVWMSHKMICSASDAQSLVWLVMPYLNYSPSPRNF